jgi:hypothetical protein
MAKLVRDHHRLRQRTTCIGDELFRAGHLVGPNATLRTTHVHVADAIPFTVFLARNASFSKLKRNGEPGASVLKDTPNSSIPYWMILRSCSRSSFSNVSLFSHRLAFIKWERFSQHPARAGVSAVRRRQDAQHGSTE